MDENLHDKLELTENLQVPPRGNETEDDILNKGEFEVKVKVPDNYFNLSDNFSEVTTIII